MLAALRNNHAFQRHLSLQYTWCLFFANVALHVGHWASPLTATHKSCSGIFPFLLNRFEDFVAEHLVATPTARVQVSRFGSPTMSIRHQVIPRDRPSVEAVSARHVGGNRGI